ncbi:MAG: hypothetical protein QM780_13455 [Hyphomicrobium sp.]|uniref:hypothetical protein n=1 Tax=Hyphomicrobium sp. TaxID=82 RepID=UPI0039E236C4
MTSIDGDFGFEAVFRKSAAELKLRLERDSDLPRSPEPTKHRGGIAAISVFGGLGILSLAIFIIGYSALQSDTPEIWIHRLMALAIAQSILISAVTMKILPIIERRGSLINVGQFAERVRPEKPAARTAAPVRFETAPPPLPAPPKPVVGGQLAGREFLEYQDGSIEIDTLIGRRRFVSLDAAREFVGS